MSASDNMLFFGVLFFVGYILPAVWAAFDAARNQITTDGNAYKTVNGALAWFLLCLLFPTIGLLFYLVRRSLAMDERRRASSLLH